MELVGQHPGFTWQSMMDHFSYIVSNLPNYDHSFTEKYNWIFLCWKHDPKKLSTDMWGDKFMPTATAMVCQLQDENVVNRPLAQFPTDMWGDKFISFSNEDNLVKLFILFIHSIFYDSIKFS